MVVGCTSLLPGQDLRPGSLALGSLVHSLVALEWLASACGPPELSGCAVRHQPQGSEHLQRGESKVRCAASGKHTLGVKDSTPEVKCDVDNFILDAC